MRETGAHLARALGPLYVPVALTTAEGSYFSEHTIREDFDLLAWVERTSAAQPVGRSD